MRFFLFIASLCTVAVATEGLRCLQCRGKSIEECDLSARVELCSFAEASCETEVRRVQVGSELKVVGVSKQCKQKQACEANEAQNQMKSGPSTQCNEDQSNSVCRCCCNDDLCNEGPLTCTKMESDPLPPAPAKLQSLTCPQQQATLYHGQYSCTDGEEPGSVCNYSCNGEYEVYPSSDISNTCHQNGSWEKPMPCCARPCPEYLLYDYVQLFHASSWENWLALLNMGDSITYHSRWGPESFQGSAVFFSDRVHEETLIQFKESNYNETKFLELFSERLIDIDFDKMGQRVNTATALWYASNYLFRERVGARDRRVPKMLAVITDAESHQDVQAAAEALRRDGILTYVYVYRNDITTFDQAQLSHLAGDKNHIYEVQDGGNKLPDKLLADLLSHFCADPCVHVLHAHSKAAATSTGLYYG